MSKEQKAQDWVVMNIDSAPDTPHFEDIWLAGYDQGERDAVDRAMVYIEEQGVKLAITEDMLNSADGHNQKLQQQVYAQVKEIERLRSALSVIKTSDNITLTQAIASEALHK